MIEHFNKYIFNKKTLIIESINFLINESKIPTEQFDVLDPDGDSIISKLFHGVYHLYVQLFCYDNDINNIIDALIYESMCLILEELNKYGICEGFKFDINHIQEIKILGGIYNDKPFEQILQLFLKKIDIHDIPVSTIDNILSYIININPREDCKFKIFLIG